MNSIEVTAKKVDEAIAEGLKKLGVTIDEVDVKILSQGGFLKKAKVLLTLESAREELKAQAKQAQKPEVKPQAKQEQRAEVKPQVKQEQRPEVKPQAKQEQRAEVKPQVKQEQRAEVKPQAKQEQRAEENARFEQRQKARPERDNKFAGENRRREPRHERAEATAEDVDRAVAFLSVLVEKMGIEANLEAKAEDGLQVEIKTQDSSVIGYRGEVLDALGCLTGVIINERGGKENYVQISVDALGYRAKRVSILESLARKMADKAIKSGRKVILEPMASHERKIIHATLTDNDQVITRSEGHEPNRRIVILPKRQNTLPQ